MKNFIQGICAVGLFIGFGWLIMLFILIDDLRGCRKENKP
jgi:hypothetical protein